MLGEEEEARRRSNANTSRRNNTDNFGFKDASIDYGKANDNNCGVVRQWNQSKLLLWHCTVVSGLRPPIHPPSMENKGRGEGCLPPLRQQQPIQIGRRKRGPRGRMLWR